jgi:hypothetical protein
MSATRSKSHTIVDETRGNDPSLREDHSADTTRNAGRTGQLNRSVKVPTRVGIGIGEAHAVIEEARHEVAVDEEREVVRPAVPFADSISAHPKDRHG